jgi:branched-chain amino acid transport system substrate-binding protein
MKDRLTRRQFLAASSAAAIAAACGPTAAPTISPTPTRAAGTAAATAGPPLKIGGLMPSTAVFAELGIAMRRAIDLYLEQSGNRLGNRPVTMIYEDEAGGPPGSLQKAQKLIEQDKVDLLIGVVITGTAYAIRNLVDSSKVVFMCTNAGGNALTRAIPNCTPACASPYIFRSSFSAAQVSLPMGTWMSQKRGVKEAFLSYTDFAFGNESAAAFTQTFTAAGGKVAGEVKPKLGEADFTQFVTRIKGQPVKDVWHFYSGTDAVKYIQTWRQLGMPAAGYNLYGAAFLVEQDVLKVVKEDAVGAITSGHWAPTLDNAENKAFVDAYRKKHNEIASIFAVAAWDGIRAFDEALKTTNGNTDDRQAFIKALEAVKFNGPRGEVAFDPTGHNIIQDIYARETKVVGGEVVNQHLEKIGPRTADPGK